MKILKSSTKTIMNSADNGKPKFNKRLNSLPFLIFLIQAKETCDLFQFHLFQRL